MGLFFISSPGVFRKTFNSFNMKTKLLVITIMLLGTAFFSSAQNFNNNQKSIGSPGIDLDKAILLHDSTGYLILGAIDTTGGHQRIYVIQINSNGDTLWTKIYDTHLLGSLIGLNGALTSDSAIAIGATVQGYRGSHQDALVVKADDSGNIAWAKTMNDSAGTADFSNTRVLSPSSGGQIVMACAQQNITLAKFCLAAMVTSGTVLWAKSYRNLSLPFTITNIVETQFGYLVTGYTNPGSSSSSQGLIVLLDAFGNVIISKTFGGVTGTTYPFSAMPVTSPSGSHAVIVSGYTSSFGAGAYDGFAAKLDSTGNFNWFKTYGASGAEIFYSASKISENKYVFAGATNSSGKGGYDGLIVTTDASGNLLKAKTYGNTGADIINSVAYNTADDILFAVGSTTSYGAGNTDCWQLGFAGADNQFRVDESSAITAVCTEDSAVFTVNTYTPALSNLSIVVDSGGFVFTSRTLDETSGQAIITDICSFVGIDPVQSTQNSFIVFPNPSSGEFTITFNQPVSNSTLRIFNTIGEQVYSEKIIPGNLNSGAKRISLHTAPGVYFAQLSDENSQVTSKLILY